MTSFTVIQDIIEDNMESSTLSEQLNENYYLTTLYLAQLSYFSLDLIRRLLDELGAHKICIYNHRGTQAYFAEFNDIAVVAFRGTIMRDRERTKLHLKTVLKFWKTDFLGHRVHKGFREALNRIEPELIRHIAEVDPKKRLLYVGHSLGGALATLMALVHRPTDICTYGSPRVSAGQDFLASFDGINVQRITTKWDWVRWLPPNIPLVLPYQHVGHIRTVSVPFEFRNPMKPHLLREYMSAITAEDADK